MEGGKSFFKMTLWPIVRQTNGGNNDVTEIDRLTNEATSALWPLPLVHNKMI